MNVKKKHKVLTVCSTTLGNTYNTSNKIMNIDFSYDNSTGLKNSKLSCSVILSNTYHKYLTLTFTKEIPSIFCIYPLSKIKLSPPSKPEIVQQGACQFAPFFQA